MILVAGGTGRLGSLLVPRLVAHGLDVRVLTRDPGRAEHLRDAGVELVVGDVRRRPDVEAATDGAATVVSLVQGFAGPGRVSPRTVDDHGNGLLSEAAASNGADMILMSVVGAAPDSAMALFRAKYAAESRVRESGSDWTIVRATAFVELWAEILAKPIVFGHGDNPINFVSVRDVAAVVERAVIDPGLRGCTLEVGGPEDLTFNELAALLHDRPGAAAKVRHVPRTVLHLLAPVARRPAAALVMDTADMTFDPATPRTGFEDLALTDVRSVLADANLSGRPPRGQSRGSHSAASAPAAGAP